MMKHIDKITFALVVVVALVILVPAVSKMAKDREQRSDLRASMTSVQLSLCQVERYRERCPKIVLISRSNFASYRICKLLTQACAW